jgi:osmotically-inducible protein OsmY
MANTVADVSKRPYGVLASGVALLALLLGVACSQNRNANVESQIQDSLNSAGLQDVTADQDQDRGVVTLRGEVPTENDKMRAEQIARSAAGEQVIANEISVQPPGFEEEAEGIQSSTDEAIEENFRAELIKNKLNTGFDYSSEQGVLTLTGEVDSAAKRTQIEKIAAAVPNVRQVVNELVIEGQSAARTTTR